MADENDAVVYKTAAVTGARGGKTSMFKRWIIEEMEEEQKRRTPMHKILTIAKVLAWPILGTWRKRGLTFGLVMGYCLAYYWAPIAPHRAVSQLWGALRGAATTVSDTVTENFVAERESNEALRKEVEELKKQLEEQ
jgi:hypothetical protein